LHDSFGLFLLCLCMLLCHANKLLLLMLGNLQKVGKSYVKVSKHFLS